MSLYQFNVHAPQPMNASDPVRALQNKLGEANGRFKL
jgi:hypothetical protein